MIFDTELLLNKLSLGTPSPDTRNKNAIPVTGLPDSPPQNPFWLETSIAQNALRNQKAPSRNRGLGSLSLYQEKKEKNRHEEENTLIIDCLRNGPG
jgi:hypothetical protein